MSGFDAGDLEDDEDIVGNGRESFGGFSCTHPGCTKRNSNGYRLRRHQIYHTGEKPFKCSQCEMSFGLKQHLKRHEILHERDKPYVCDWEGKIYSPPFCLFFLKLN